MTGQPALPSPMRPPQAPVHNRERAVAGILVLLLHLVMLWLFLSVKLHLFELPPPSFRNDPITIWLPLPHIAPAPEAPIRADSKDKKRALRVAPPVKKAEGMPQPPPKPASPEPGLDYNGLRALGRYLNNCSGLYYEALSQHQVAHCLGNQWDIPLPGEDPRLRLGAEAPSVWKDERDKRDAPAPPIAKDCAPSSRNSNLGLPCIDLTH